MLYRTHERGERLCVLPSLHDLPGQHFQLESPRLQQVKHATSAKDLGIWDWSVLECLDTSVVFQTTIFLILVVRNNNKSSGLYEIIVDYLSRICLHYRLLELSFC